MEYHPGGEDELMRAAGSDGTDLFDQVRFWSKSITMEENSYM
jgi:cytochrome-b5 reductase